ncbi:lipoyl synthase [Hydrogenovibrio marinus]|uniref:Lipoyl synthase n=1 Tax=Hydrogenovibrio marinus TaxID=28885 RepID=A0A066ZSR2_HYDMR|nr:lipoyl synthase [Hydrogenovibrio marinus]KDN96532.1 lipoyl synthase [Hydrogenovibrio marinus]BBN60263.1 lipoyl synthase [Hydrogenovibrio marinus]
MSAPNFQEIPVNQITGLTKTSDEASSDLKQRREEMSKGEYKTKSLKHKPDPSAPKLKKPTWIKAKLPAARHIGRVKELKNILREQGLNTVCEEASCPNLGECFGHGTATFMIMGHICTRKCPFCDVTHGRPKALDKNEPQHLAETIEAMKLNYIVITSVDRDDLRDGGATHFRNCIAEIRQRTPEVKIETLVPDFRGRLTTALETLSTQAPDVLNHNLETIPRLYEEARPGADYQASLDLLKRFKQMKPETTTKSGLMVGLGETMEELLEVMRDLRAHDVEMLTVGQYLQPSNFHLAVKKYWTPDEFKAVEEAGYEMGFTHVASGPMVRSSYHADLQAQGKF